jgi:hypothetical protein
MLAKSTVVSLNRRDTRVCGCTHKTAAIIRDRATARASERGAGRQAVYHSLGTRSASLERVVRERRRRRYAEAHLPSRVTRRFVVITRLIGSVSPRKRSPRPVG